MPRKRKPDYDPVMPRGKPLREKPKKEPVVEVFGPPSPTPWSIYDPNAEVSRTHNIKFRPVYVVDANGDHIFCVGTEGKQHLANAELIVRAVNKLMEKGNNDKRSEPL